MARPATEPPSERTAATSTADARRNPEDLMLKSIAVIGLSYHNAELALRERFAFTEQQVEAVLQSICWTHEFDEAVLISTCNRIEFVLVGENAVDPLRGRDAVLSMLQAIASFRLDDLKNRIYHLCGPEALAHLFRVAGGLDSMIVGEAQILGQVKSAYATAHKVGATGAVLNQVFQRSFRVAKVVRTKTAIARNAISVGSIVRDLAISKFGNLDSCTVLIVGAGQVATLVARYLRAANVGRLIITSRSYERAQTLAQLCAGTALEISALESALVSADLVVGAAARPPGSAPLVSVEQVEEIARHRMSAVQLFIDLAVPRNFPAAAEIGSGGEVYDVDDLGRLVVNNRQGRELEVRRAEAIIADEVQKFLLWQRRRSVDPVICRLRAHWRATLALELRRTMRRLRRDGVQQNQLAQVQAALEKFGLALTTKFLHEITIKLKSEVEEERESALFASELFISSSAKLPQGKSSSPASARLRGR
jgi:glutamyl-tRNA reductase